MVGDQYWHDILAYKFPIVSLQYENDLIISARPISFLHKPQGTIPLTLYLPSKVAFSEY